MAIEALLENPRQDVPVLNVTDEVGANMEALRLSGLVIDSNREVAEQQVTQEFGYLGQVGVAGEMIVAIPQRQLPLSQRIATLDTLTQAKHGEGHPPTYVYKPLWTPGTESGSYTDGMLGLLGPEYDGKDWKAHGRLVVPNSDSPSEPILHHLDMPFDGKYADEGEETQLEALAKQKAAFEAKHPEANLNPLTARDVSFLALVRLVKGEPMPMEWGYMRDGTLHRRTVGGGSLVGDVHSSVGQLRLDGSYGSAYPSGGVGVSVGLQDLKS